jgi:hypothetical protein
VSACRHAWQRDDYGGGRQPGDRNDCQPCAYGVSRVSGNGCSKSKRRKGDAVDQPEHDER